MSIDRNKIMLFSDLEGTLISEDGVFNDEQFYNFVSEIYKLAQTVKADVQITILSPMGPKYMTQMLKEMDRRLRRREFCTHGEYAVDVINAAADFNDIVNDEVHERYDSRIDTISSFSSARTLIDIDAKYRYVKSVLTTKSQFPTKKPLLYMYSGNGKNDISAMKYINSLSNGITMCPSNIPEEVGKVATLHSKYDEAQGIADCIKQVREKIEQRLTGTKSEESPIITEEIK